MCAKPESRIDWVTSLVTAVCSPVSKAAATPPSGLGSAFRMRAVMSARSPSMVRTMPLGLPMLDDGRGCQRITDATDLLVPGDPLEIEGPWRGRSCRWRDIRQHQQPVAHRQRRCALAERNAQPDRSHLDPRSAVALQAHGFEDDPLTFGQALDVGDAAFDVDAEQRPRERRC